MARTSRRLRHAAGLGRQAGRAHASRIFAILSGTALRWDYLQEAQLGDVILLPEMTEFFHLWIQEGYYTEWPGRRAAVIPSSQAFLSGDERTGPPGGGPARVTQTGRVAAGGAWQTDRRGERRIFRRIGGDRDGSAQLLGVAKSAWQAAYERWARDRLSAVPLRVYGKTSKA